MINVADSNSSDAGSGSCGGEKAEGEDRRENSGKTHIVMEGVW